MSVALVAAIGFYTTDIVVHPAWVERCATYENGDRLERRLTRTWLRGRRDETCRIRGATTLACREDFPYFSDITTRADSVIADSGSWYELYDGALRSTARIGPPLGLYVLTGFSTVDTPPGGLFVAHAETRYPGVPEGFGIVVHDLADGRLLFAELVGPHYRMDVAGRHVLVDARLAWEVTRTGLRALTPEDDTLSACVFGGERSGVEPEDTTPGGDGSGVLWFRASTTDLVVSRLEGGDLSLPYRASARTIAHCALCRDETVVVVLRGSGGAFDTTRAARAIDGSLAVHTVGFDRSTGQVRFSYAEDDYWGPTCGLAAP